jgi:hypothetical protein
MSTSISLHANRGDSIQLKIRDWTNYISVSITFGDHTVDFYPVPKNVGESTAEQVRELLVAFANAEVSHPSLH